MPKVKEELVLIDSNQDTVTGSNQGDIDLNLYDTFIDDFALTDQKIVPMSDLPTSIHTF